MFLKIATTASLAASLLALAACSGNGDEGSYRTPEEGMSMDTTTSPASPTSPSVRGVSFEMADGSTTSMDAYEGRVVMVVNVASACGLRPQVAELQTLYEQNKAEGFTVIAFPSASFNQEPLDAEGAADFCQAQGATYPVAAKVDVKGQSAHPLFATLSKQGGEPDWNYTKYLVDKDGRVIARFAPRTSPTAPEVQAAIDEALKG
ncbi:MAG: glutathione peroxidase [Phycisphaerales bacterium JB060]